MTTTITALPAAASLNGSELLAADQTVSGTTTTVKIPVGAASGVATLDAGGKVPAAQLGNQLVNPLKLMVGTAAANGQPMLFAAGPILTTAIDGAVGYDGAKYWKAVGTVWYRDVYSNSLALPSSPAVGASPFVYQNTSNYDVDIVIVGGTVSAVSFSRDGATYYPLGILQVPIMLSPGDRIQITYTVAPTLTLIPR